MRSAEDIMDIVDILEACDVTWSLRDAAERAVCSSHTAYGRPDPRPRRWPR